MEKSKRDAIVELVNKLFVYTDSQQWQRLLAGVFKEEVFFDMSSMGGGAGTTLKATEICKAWKEGFSNLDQVHHHSGNFIVDFLSEIEANVFCYATATHYKASATRGTTREFVGSYELHVSFTDQGWRIDSFKYQLKYASGNKDLL